MAQVRRDGVGIAAVRISPLGFLALSAKRGPNARRPPAVGSDTVYTVSDGIVVDVRTVLIFITVPIPDTATFSSATLRLKADVGGATTSVLGLRHFTPSSTAIDSAQFQVTAGGQTTYATNLGVGTNGTEHLINVSSIFASGHRRRKTNASEAVHQIAS